MDLAVARLQLQHHARRRARQCDQRQGEGTDQVALAHDFAPLDGHGKRGANQPGEKNTQFAKPFKRRRNQTDHVRLLAV